jgi:hypothetical protein
MSNPNLSKNLHTPYELLWRLLELTKVNFFNKISPRFVQIKDIEKCSEVKNPNQLTSLNIKRKLWSDN